MRKREAWTLACLCLITLLLGAKTGRVIPVVQATRTETTSPSPSPSVSYPSHSLSEELSMSQTPELTFGSKSLSLSDEPSLSMTDGTLSHLSGTFSPSEELSMSQTPRTLTPRTQSLSQSSSRTATDSYHSWTRSRSGPSPTFATATESTTWSASISDTESLTASRLTGTSSDTRSGASLTHSHSGQSRSVTPSGLTGSNTITVSRSGESISHKTLSKTESYSLNTVSGTRQTPTGSATMSPALTMTPSASSTGSVVPTMTPTGSMSDSRAPTRSATPTSNRSTPTGVPTRTLVATSTATSSFTETHTDSVETPTTSYTWYSPTTTSSQTESGGSGSVTESATSTHSRTAPTLSPFTQSATGSWSGRSTSLSAKTLSPSESRSPNAHTETRLLTTTRTLSESASKLTPSQSQSETSTLTEKLSHTQGTQSVSETGSKTDTHPTATSTWPTNSWTQPTATQRTDTSSPSASATESATRSPSVDTLSLSSSTTHTISTTPSVSGSFSSTVTTTITPAPTPSETFTPSPSITHTRSLTASPSLTATESISVSPSPSGSATVSVTQPPTPSNTFTKTGATWSSTRSLSYSGTQTVTITPPPTPTVTFTLSRTLSESPTTTVTITPPPTPTVTFSHSATLSLSRSRTDSSSVTDNTESLSSTYSVSPSLSDTGMSQSSTETVTITPPPTLSPSLSGSLTTTVTVSPAPTPSRVLSPSVYTMTPSATITEAPTLSSTISPPPTMSRTLSLSRTFYEWTRTQAQTVSSSDSFSMSASESELTETLGFTLTTTPELSLTESEKTLSLSASGPQLRIVSPFVPNKNVNPQDTAFTNGRDASAAADDPYFFLPKLYGSAIRGTAASPSERRRRQGGAQSEIVQRQMILDLVGGQWDTQNADIAEPNDRGRYFYDSAGLDVSDAPVFGQRMFRLWSSGALRVNATHFTWTLPVDPGFNLPPGAAEKVRLQFHPECFVDHAVPTPSSVDFVVLAGTPDLWEGGGDGMPSTTATDADGVTIRGQNSDGSWVTSLNPVQTGTTVSESIGVVATAGTAALGASASALALSKAFAVLNIAACNGVYTPLSVFEHPTRVSMGAPQDDGTLHGLKPPLGQYLGALVMNPILVLAVLLFHFGVGLILQGLTHSRSAKWEATTTTAEGDVVGRGPDDASPKPQKTSKVTWTFCKGFILQAMIKIHFPAKSAWLILFYPSCFKCLIVLYFAGGPRGASDADLAVPPIIGTFVFLVCWIVPLAFLTYLVIANNRFMPYYRTRAELHEAAADAWNAHQRKQLQAPLGAQHIWMAQGGAGGRGGDAVVEHTREGELLAKDIEEFTNPPNKLIAFFQPRGLWSEGASSEAGFNIRHVKEQREASLGFLQAMQLATPSQQKKTELQQRQAERARTGGSGVVEPGVMLYHFYVAFLADFFEDYRTRKFRAFLFLELIIATCIAGIDGYAIATQHCASMSIFLLCVLVLHFLVIIASRPYDVSGNNLFFVILTMVQVVLGIIAVVATHSSGPPTAEVGTMMTMVLVLQYVFFIKAFWDFCSLGYTVYQEGCSGAANKENKKKKEEKKQIDKYISPMGSSQDNASSVGGGATRETVDHFFDGPPETLDYVPTSTHAMVAGANEGQELQEQHHPAHGSHFMTTGDQHSPRPTQPIPRPGDLFRHGHTENNHSRRNVHFDDDFGDEMFTQQEMQLRREQQPQLRVPSLRHHQQMDRRSRFESASPGRGPSAEGLYEYADSAPQPRERGRGNGMTSRHRQQHLRVPNVHNLGGRLGGIGGTAGVREAVEDSSQPVAGPLQAAAAPSVTGPMASFKAVSRPSREYQVQPPWQAVPDPFHGMDDDGEPVEEDDAPPNLPMQDVASIQRRNPVSPAQEVQRRKEERALRGIPDPFDDTSSTPAASPPKPGDEDDPFRDFL